jgi:hypothetical protein
MSRPRSQTRSRLVVERLEGRELLDASPVAAQFVTGLYYDLLHRSPSQPEVSAWVGFLAAGHTRDEVAAAFISSGEYRINLIRHDYETLLGREPEAGVTTRWLGLMNLGMGQQSLLLNIVMSAEYSQRNGGTNQSWVTALYRDVLGRTPDPGPLVTWTRALDIGLARGTVAISFIFGAEEDSRNIAGAYETVLGRNVDPGAATSWFGAFQQGMGTEQLLQALFASGEYLTQQSGVNPALDDNAGGSGILAFGAAPLTITLQAAHSAINGQPTVTVSLNDATFDGRVRFDVDANGDAGFSNAADLNQTIGLINPRTQSFSLNPLGHGTYLVRARIYDGFGRLYVSPTVTVTIA